jgi:hypothetical protein
MFEVTFIFLIVFIDSLCVLFSYVDNLGEIWTVSFSSTNDQLKNNYTKAMARLCLDNKDGLELDDSDEDSTTDYEDLVTQHKDSLYYTESREEERVEEGTVKICNRK